MAYFRYVNINNKLSDFMGMKLVNKAGYHFFLHSRNIRTYIKSQRNCQVSKTKRPKVEVFPSIQRLERRRRFFCESCMKIQNQCTKLHVCKQNNNTKCADNLISHDKIPALHIRY